MATRFLVVKDVFDIAGRGLIIEPGPLLNSHIDPLPRDVAVRLVLPDAY
jgi:hypothetical protein